MRLFWGFAVGSACVASFVLACGDDDAGPGPTDGGASDVAVTNDGDADGGSLPPGTLTLATGQEVRAISVTATHLYWTEGVTGAPGAVRRVPIAGGTAETLASPPALPGPLAVDATHVYFATEAKNVMRVPIGGGTAEEIAKSLGGVPPPIFSVAVDANGVFWLEGGALRRAQIDGGGAQLIGSTNKQAGFGISIAGEDVWWTSFDNGNFVGSVASTKANADGGQPSIIYAQDEKEPWGIAAGAAGVFWANQGTIANKFVDGTIRTRAQTGDIISIASDLSTPAAIALDGTTLYFTVRGAKNPAAVMKMATAGGAPTVVVDATGKKLADTIAVDATKVYWSADGAIHATPK